MMLVRTIIGECWRSYSEDGGLTWDQPEPSGIDCGGTVYLTRLKSGRLALVWNRAVPSNTAKMGWPNGFESMWIALSPDDGKSWFQPVEFARGIKDRVVHSLVLSVSDNELLFTMPVRKVMMTTEEDQLLNGPLLTKLLVK